MREAAHRRTGIVSGVSDRSLVSNKLRLLTLLALELSLSDHPERASVRFFRERLCVLYFSRPRLIGFNGSGSKGISVME